MSVIRPAGRLRAPLAVRELQKGWGRTYELDFSLQFRYKGLGQYPANRREVTTPNARPTAAQPGAPGSSVSAASGSPASRQGPPALIRNPAIMRSLRTSSPVRACPVGSYMDLPFPLPPVLIGPFPRLRCRITHCSALSPPRLWGRTYSSVLVLTCSSHLVCLNASYSKYLIAGTFDLTQSSPKRLPLRPPSPSHAGRQSSRPIPVTRSCWSSSRAKGTVRLSD